jgi:hypothetical protein
MRFVLAFKCFFALLFRGRLPEEARPLLPSQNAPPLPLPEAPEAEGVERSAAIPSAPPPPPREDGRGAAQLLALLQREGRLLDFLQEEIDGYSDAQVGAAVRDIHRGCRRALAEHLPLEPVLPDAENSRVRVDPGFDPARIRLIGNVVGEPPFTGTLKHHGWRIAKVSLPQGADSQIVAPAEVELT